MNIQDIRQGKNGDCFILASLISLLFTFGNEYMKNIVKHEKDNNYIFTYFSDINLKKKISFRYENSNDIISPKSAEWVKIIEFAYIKLFHKNNENVIKNGGSAYNVLFNLTGIKPKVYINKLFDNQEELYYDLCNNTITNTSWGIESFNYINKLSNWKLSIWIELIWKYLKNISEKIENNIWRLKKPAIIGINGIYNKIEIPGVLNDHCYSINKLLIDNFGNKYIEVCNPHCKTECRKTSFNANSNNFESKISIDRFGVWSFQEVAVFSSDITYIT